MAGISGISGLIAGFNTKGAVDELLAPKQAEIDALVARQDTESQKQSALLDLNTALRDFRSIALNMSDAGNFFSYTASLSSDNASVPASNILDISGTNSVNTGNHSIVVDQLAQAQRNSSSAAVTDSLGSAIASSATSLGTTGSFQINGTTINVTAGDSLQDIATSINNENTLTGVTASVVKVADSDFRLVLNADDTGATGFTLTGSDLNADTSGSLAALNFGAVGQSNASQVLQAAQDAQVSIDGLIIYRSTNTISDVLDGITLNLKQASPATTVTMSVSVDQAAVQDQILGFIDAYNTISTFINDQYAFNSDTGERGLLSGESMLGAVQSKLSNMLFQSVAGLASDRNSLVKIGIAPDEKGQLTINDTLFSEFLNNNINAIRDVFVATGSSSNADIQFLVTGQNTPSGSYAVNINTAATFASVTGTTDLVGGTLAANESVTITESSSGRQAIVDLLAGQNQSDIINALNTELSTEYSEVRLFDQALLDGASPATGSSTFSALGLGVSAGDSITISGTSRTGTLVQGSFTVLDPATDTLSDLLTAIQSAFGQKVVASVDANGRIQVSDSQGGDSLLGVSLTANNEGGGTLDFGVDNSGLSTEGRFAMSIEAVVSGNGVAIQHKNYGSSSGFSIAQSVDGLGITDGSFSGIDLTGTLNGEAATGSGQMLIGTVGNADGLAILYTGTATGSVGSLVLGVGVAALLDGSLDTFSNPFTGLIQNSVYSSEDNVQTISNRIADLEAQMQKQRVTLTNSFTQMEKAMSTLQQTGSFLTQNMNALYGTRRN